MHVLDHVLGHDGPHGDPLRDAHARAMAAGSVAQAIAASEKAAAMGGRVAPPVQGVSAPSWVPGQIGNPLAWWEQSNRRLREAVGSWTDVNAWHRWTQRQLMGGLWGVEVPAEGVDPDAARDYLIDSMVQLGTIHGWPPDAVQARIAAMRTVPATPEVGPMLDRLKVYGPDPAWPGGEDWYTLLEYLRESASLVSVGERSRLFQRRIEQAGGVYYDNLKQARADALPILDKLADGLRLAGVGTALTGPFVGLGLGIGVGGALIAVGTVAGAIVFFPELSEGLAGIRASRKARKGSSSSKGKGKGNGKGSGK